MFLHHFRLLRLLLRNTPCGTRTECLSCGSAHAIISSAPSPTQACHSKTPLQHALGSQSPLCYVQQQRNGNVHPCLKPAENHHFQELVTDRRCD